MDLLDPLENQIHPRICTHVCACHMCVGWLRAVVHLTFATVSVQFSLALTQKGCFSKTDSDGTDAKLGSSVTWWGMTMDTPTSQLKESTFGQGAASLCINPYFLYVTQLLSQFFPPSFPNVNNSGHSFAFPISVSMTSLMGFHLFLNVYQGTSKQILDIVISQ